MAEKSWLGHKVLVHYQAQKIRGRGEVNTWQDVPIRISIWSCPATVHAQVKDYMNTSAQDGRRPWLVHKE
jgi:hypothetical protein